MVHVGIDVGKDTLSCCIGSTVREFANTETGREEILDWSGSDAQLCMESTGRFHLGIANLAQSRRIRCVVLDPLRAKKYLSFVTDRGKTDAMDARALARLSEKEGDRLRAYAPVAARIQAARDIQSRRRAAVESRVKLEQVIGSVGDPEKLLGRAVESLKTVEKQLGQDLCRILKGYPEYELLKGIPAIGPVSASLLLCALERGEFATSDSLVAFAGLDPTPSDSGKKRGKRRLSSRGDAQLRTALFMAAQTAARLPEWRGYYLKQLEKGYSTTQSTIIVARKLVRVAWSIYKTKRDFVPAGGKTLDKET
jgi:transposase